METKPDFNTVKDFNCRRQTIPYCQRIQSGVRNPKRIGNRFVISPVVTCAPKGAEGVAELPNFLTRSDWRSLFTHDERFNFGSAAMSGRIPLPNYTQVPNIILDAIQDLSGGETKVIFAVCRQTFGFHERRAQLAISRMMELTGLAKASVVEATKRLVDRRWLKKIKAGDSHSYEVDLEVVGCSEIEHVQKVNTGCSETSPEGVQKADRSKKEERIKESTETAERIYGLYPRKIGKPAALKSILKALKGNDAEKLETAVKAFAAARVGTDMEFCPHPATWFNQERFNDDVATYARRSEGILPPGVRRGQMPPKVQPSQIQHETGRVSL